MLWVVLPVTAAGRQLRRARPPYTANSSWTASTTYTTYTTCTTNATCAANTTWTASTSCTANTANSSNTAGSSNAANTTYTTRATPTRQLGRSVAAADVRIAIEIIVDVDVDAASTPTASPAPPATPHCAHRDTNAERYRHPSRVVSRWRIVNGRIRIYRWSVHHHWIVRRHVHHLRIRLFDDDRALSFDDLCLYFLLLTRLQIAGILSLLTHTLDCIHHIGLLCQKRVAEISCPLNIVCQPFD